MIGPYAQQRFVFTSPDGLDDPNIFPRLIGMSFLVKKAPEWSTAIVSSVSGRERRRKLWSYPRWHFNVAYEVLRDAPATPDLQRLVSFFNMKAGRFAPFMFFDPSDCRVQGQRFGTGDGIATTFPLARTMAFGGVTFSEPVGGTFGAVAAYIDGAPALNVTVANGVATFASPPPAGAALTWDGTFGFRVRFDADMLDTEQLMQGLWSVKGIDFQTVKA